MIHPKASAGFGSQADSYERARPGYPDAAVDLLAAYARGPVLDLGAGTGKLTRALVARGLDVVAAEPVEEMRALLASTAAPRATVAAVAEHLPFANASFSLATVAQAFHWFESQRASAELARIVAPDGHLAIIWNARAVTEDWHRRLWALMDEHERDAPWRTRQGGAGLPPTSPWVEVRRSEYDHTTPATVDLVLDRLMSVSHVAALAPDARDAVLDEARTIAQSVAGPLVLPYRTTLVVYRR